MQQRSHYQVHSPTLSAMTDDTIGLYRPVGPKELELVRQSGFLRFPPRLPEQPIFYPVLNLEYAEQIARDWNVRASGFGAVTAFQVRRTFLDRDRKSTRLNSS